jgi:3D (Asp-Asp-Asp) domain-containing protein
MQTFSARYLLIGLAIAVLVTILLTDESENVMVVSATAYNSVPSQTSGDPNVGAWGHPIRPGMKVIAVSRDLIDLGLTPGTTVRIQNMPGKYIVRDKMHPRWKRKIDIYMGRDIEAALEFGTRKLEIEW